jgi:hypothetical protein
MQKLRHAFLLGLVLTLLGVGLLWKSVSTLFWKPVQATVIAVTDRPYKSARPLKPYVLPESVYQYDVNGAHYSGKTVFRHDERYAVNQTFTVYYNPDDAGKSVVHRGLTFAELTSLLGIPLEMGIVIMLTSGIAILGASQKQTQKA